MPPKKKRIRSDDSENSTVDSKGNDLCLSELGSINFYTTAIKLKLLMLMKLVI